jgi:hypothetical protein
MTGTLVRGTLADIGFATIFAFVFSGSTLEQSASKYRPNFPRNSQPI